jgi:hypothetical protein
LIGPVVTSNALIWSRAGGERSAIGAVVVFVTGQPFVAGAPVMSAIGTLVSLAVPSPFLAVTMTRSEVPPSAFCSV